LAGFKAELQRQFGVSDARGEARIRLKNLKRGKHSVTEYWNEFPLVASEAELDDSTGGELLPGAMITELQNALRASSAEYECLEALAPMGNPEGNQVDDSHTYPRIAINKKRPTGNHHTTKPRRDISTHK